MALLQRETGIPEFTYRRTGVIRFRLRSRSVSSLALLGYGVWALVWASLIQFCSGPSCSFMAFASSEAAQFVSVRSAPIVDLRRRTEPVYSGELCRE